MRKIGSVASSQLAQRFHAYLTSKGIQNKVDQAEGQWDIWIYDEEKLQSGKEELEQFRESPSDVRFHAPPPAPVSVPRPALRPVRTQPTGSGRAQVTIMITALSLAITLGSGFGKDRAMLEEFWLAPPGQNLSLLLSGQIWRLYTPMFMHFGVLHLVFNVYLFWMLGGMIERFRGPRTLLLLILAIAPFSHLTEYFYTGAPFGGLSGVVYGLVGFLWIRSVVLPEDGYEIPESLVFQLIIWAILGLTGLLGNMANGAHFGGLIAGMLIGYAPRLWRDH